jgi:hypothetical protein
MAISSPGVTFDSSYFKNLLNFIVINLKIFKKTLRNNYINEISYWHLKK